MAVLRRNTGPERSLPASLAHPDHASWVPPDVQHAEPAYQAYRAFCAYAEALCAWHGDSVGNLDVYLPPGADLRDFVEAFTNT